MGGVHLQGSRVQGMTKPIILTGAAREKSRIANEKARLRRREGLSRATPEERLLQEKALEVDRLHNLSRCPVERKTLREAHREFLATVTESMLERKEIGIEEREVHGHTTTGG